MTSSEYELFLSGAMALCALMALLVAFRYKSRGASALVMSVAFLVFGGVLYLLKSGAPQGWVTAGGILLGLLLLTDFILRAGRQVDKDKRP